MGIIPFAKVTTSLAMAGVYLPEAGMTVEPGAPRVLGTFPELRYEPTAKRIQATLGGNTVVDTLHAWLVWGLSVRETAKTNPQL